MGRTWRWFGKRTVYTALLCVFMLMPGMGVFEEDVSILLAKSLYQMGRYEVYDTLIALGSVAMNRVEDSRFPDTIKEVLNEPGVFSRGGRYDERTLSAARAVLMGKRTLPDGMVYFMELEEELNEVLGESRLRSGRYVFSSE